MTTLDRAREDLVRNEKPQAQPLVAPWFAFAPTKRVEQMGHQFGRDGATV